MKTDLFNKYVADLIKSALTDTDIQKQIRKATHSGAIDVAAIPDCDYMQVKALAYVILSNAAESVKPKGKDGQKEIDNLKCFI